MNIEAFREYCLSKIGVEESFPFGPNTLVFKVLNKIFAITSLDSEIFSANLKSDPEKAIALRERYIEIQPGYHMNKKHWNTVNFEAGVHDNLLYELIDHSYDLVVRTLKKTDREKLKRL